MPGFLQLATDLSKYGRETAGPSGQGPHVFSSTSQPFRRPQTHEEASNFIIGHTSIHHTYCVREVVSNDSQLLSRGNNTQGGLQSRIYPRARFRPNENERENETEREGEESRYVIQ